MNKKDFTDFMQWLIEKKGNSERLRIAMDNYDPEYSHVVPDGEWEGQIIRLLEIVMDDRAEWISYWVYDLNCGEDYKKGSITKKDGTPIPLKTTIDLYNLLTNQDDD